MLAGWQAALVHPIEHVDELGQLVHLHDGHSHDEGSLCDQLAALTACAAKAQAVFGNDFSNYAVTSGSLVAPRVAEAPPFLSQGPPASA